MNKILLSAFIGLTISATVSAQLKRQSLDCSTDINAIMHKKRETTPGRGVADNFYTWDNGATILVKFMPGGSADIRKRIMDNAKKWEQYANITFKFVADTTKFTNIRVKLNQGKGHNSAIGVQCNFRSQDEATLNLDTMDMLDMDYYFAKARSKGISIQTWDQFFDVVKTDPGHWNTDIIRRKAVHEFGHSLGLLHEQSYPGIIKWNKSDSVYAYYEKNQEWDRETVDHNVFQVNKQSYTNGSAYDPRSVMHHDIETWQTLDGYSLKSSMDMSEGDKKMIAGIYPKDKAQSDFLVSKIKLTGPIKVSVVNNISKGGISVYPSFDLSTNPKMGQVYYLVKLLDENGDDIPAVGEEYNVDNIVAGYLFFNLAANSKFSYNKKGKDLEIFFPYNKIPGLKGKKIKAEFRILQRDVVNEEMRLLSRSTTTSFLNVPK